MSIDLRKKTLAKRALLSEIEVNSRSKKIVDNLLSTKLLQSKSSVFIYLSYKTEVATFSLAKKLLSEGFKVSVPVTTINDNRMLPVLINKDVLYNFLEKGPYGIYQPTSNIVKTNSSLFQDISFCICPGSIFDRSGGRCGYGGGFYDRFLAKPECREITKIGLCYDFQLFDKIDQKEHDIKMDFVFTESEALKPNSETI